MENNPFESKFREISDEALFESLHKRNGYQDLAQKAMLEEALFRKLIENETDEAISEAFIKFKTEKAKTQNNTISYNISLVQIICYSYGTLFCLVGLLGFFFFYEFPFEAVIMILFFFFPSFFLFYFPARFAKKKTGKLKQYNKTGKPGWITVGYVFSVLGSIMSLIICLGVYFSGKKEIGELKIYEFDEKTRKQALNMVFVNIFINIIVIFLILRTLMPGKI
jgi:hypothetical protein